MKPKTRKSISKRFKFTKTGKILRRQTGQNHFRTKKSSNLKRRKKRLIPLSAPEQKIVKNFLTYNK